MRFLLISAAVLLSLIALYSAGLYVIERNREKAAEERWSELVEAAKAEGRALNVGYRPLSVSPSQNLLALPLFVEWQKDKETWDEAMGRLTLFTNNSRKADKGWDEGVGFRTETFDERYQTSTVERLADLQPVLDAIRAAVENHRYIASSLPREGDIDGPALIFRLKATILLKYSALVALEAAEGDAAFDDLLTAFKLHEVEGEKVAIAALTDFASRISTQEVIATGLASHQWSGEQVALLRKKLEDFQPLKEFEAHLDGEREFFFENIGKPQTCMESSDWPWLAALQEAVVPSAGVAQNKVYFLEFTRQYLPPCFDAEKGLIDFKAINRLAEESKTCPFPVTRMALDIYPSLIRRAALLQSWRNQAIIACTLELYWKEHQQYPGTLAEAEASGCPLPCDPVTDKQYHYRRTAGGSYLLYSTGWDEGSISRNQDWLWMLPGLTSEEIAECEAQFLEVAENDLSE